MPVTRPARRRTANYSDDWLPDCAVHRGKFAGSEMTRELLDKAPYLWLPTACTYAAWWPWVKNYEGEIYGGGFWWAPVCARIGVDQDLKKKMGF